MKFLSIPTSHFSQAKPSVPAHTKGLPCFPTQTKLYSVRSFVAVILLLAFSLLASPAQTLANSFQQIGSEEVLLNTAPHVARLKPEGFTYVDQPKVYAGDSDPRDPTPPPLFEGSGKAYYVPNNGSAILLSDQANNIQNFGNFNSIEIVPFLSQPTSTTNVTISNDGSQISPPLVALGANGNSLYGFKTFNTSEIAIYDVENEQLSEPSFQVGVNQQISDYFSNFFDILDTPVDPLALIGSVDGALVGLAPSFNSDDPNAPRHFSYFTYFPDGTSIRYGGSASASLVDGLLIDYAHIKYYTVDGLFSGTPTINGTQFYILGADTAEGFGFGTSGHLDSQLFGIFDLETGETLYEFDLGGEIYDVDYLGNNKFTYLAESDGALVRGNFQVVPIPASAWLLGSSLLLLRTMKSRRKNVRH